MRSWLKQSEFLNLPSLIQFSRTAGIPFPAIKFLQLCHCHINSTDLLSCLISPSEGIKIRTMKKLNIIFTRVVGFSRVFYAAALTGIWTRKKCRGTISRNKKCHVTKGSPFSASLRPYIPSPYFRSLWCFEMISVSLFRSRSFVPAVLYLTVSAYREPIRLPTRHCSDKKREGWRRSVPGLAQRHHTYEEPSALWVAR